MEYLFTNKEVKVGDIALVICNKSQYENFNLQKYFPKVDIKSLNMNRFGVKVINVSKTKLQGYMVYQRKSEPGKIGAWKYNNKNIYLNITNSNCVGLLKFR